MSDGLPGKRRLEREVGRCEDAVTALLEKKYVLDRDLLMLKVYRVLLLRHRENLAALRARPPAAGRLPGAMAPAGLAGEEGARVVDAA